VSRVRRLVPRAVRRRVSAALARARARLFERDLAALAAGNRTIVAGPWLGEVGFEILYWIPFLRWFADAFAVAPERLIVVSRGGTSSWYRPFAAGYREIFDALTVDEFRRRHAERVAANGEQKQTQVLAFERDLLRAVTSDVESRAMLHPSSMYRLFNPFWWRHLDEAWVHRRARYGRFEAPPLPGRVAPEPYTAVKFYFNDCFPATERNRAFVRAIVQSLAASGPVVSLTTGLHVDDHDGVDAAATSLRSLLPDVGPASNLAVQTAIIARASAFVGTYGGFSYLAPFLGVPATAYFDDPAGFSPRHLSMALSALSRIGHDGLLEVRSRVDVQPPGHG
jgi:hypothetical protein